MWNTMRSSLRSKARHFSGTTLLCAVLEGVSCSPWMLSRRNQLGLPWNRTSTRSRPLSRLLPDVREIETAIFCYLTQHMYSDTSPAIIGNKSILFSWSFLPELCFQTLLNTSNELAKGSMWNISTYRHTCICVHSRHTFSGASYLLSLGHSLQVLRDHCSEIWILEPELCTESANIQSKFLEWIMRQVLVYVDRDETRTNAQKQDIELLQTALFLFHPLLFSSCQSVRG